MVYEARKIQNVSTEQEYQNQTQMFKMFSVNIAFMSVWFLVKVNVCMFVPGTLSNFSHGCAVRTRKIRTVNTSNIAVYEYAAFGLKTCFANHFKF